MLNRRKFLTMLGRGVALSLVASTIPSPLAAMIPKESEEERMKRLNPVTKLGPARTRMPAPGWRKIYDGVTPVGNPSEINQLLYGDGPSNNIVELLNETNIILRGSKYV